MVKNFKLRSAKHNGRNGHPRHSAGAKRLGTQQDLGERIKNGLWDELAADMNAAVRVRSLTGSFLRGDLSALLEEVLSAAIEVTHADFGNVQLLNPATENLKIVAHSGFKPKFLEYFDQVHQGEAACGTAMQNRQRVLVEDVTHSPVFRDGRTIEVLLEAGIRGVQSTPLISRSGEIVGMISTHYCMPWLPSERELRMLDMITLLAANFIERKVLNPIHEAGLGFPSPATTS